MFRPNPTWRPDAPPPPDPTPLSRVHPMLEELEQLRAEVQQLRYELAQARQQASAPIAAPAPRVTREFTSPVAAPRAHLAPVPPAAPANDLPPAAPFPIAPSGPTFLLSADQGIDFGAVAQLSPAELDALPYGLITLDAEGRVLHYNDTESRMVGLPKERVLGRKFFGEVAPCARVREFEGRFQELVRDPHRVRVQTFDFVFRFANGEQQVTIVMTPSRLRGQYNIALLRRGG